MSAIVKVVATFTVKADKAEEFVASARKTAEATLAEEGCSAFEFVKVRGFNSFRRSLTYIPMYEYFTNRLSIRKEHSKSLNQPYSANVFYGLSCLQSESITYCEEISS